MDDMDGVDRREESWSPIRPRKRGLVILRVTGVLIPMFVLVACRRDSGGDRAPAGAPADPSRPVYVATIHPMAAILREVVGDRGQVIQLLSPGVSPHTYDPRPSDAAASEKALALFYDAESLDGWAARLPARRRVCVFDLVPSADRLDMGDLPAESAGLPRANEPSGQATDSTGRNAQDHEHAGPDPHFWMDPIVVKAALPGLINVLAELDPAGRPAYEANGAQFAAELDDLDRTAREILAPVAGAAVVLHHPSVRYLLHRYGLREAGAIEAAPGKEPSPREIQSLIEQIRGAKVKALFNEPQLPARPVEVVAEAAGLPVFTLDPNGGVAGRDTYAELILFNAAALRKALE